MLPEEGVLRGTVRVGYYIQEQRDLSYSFSATVGQIIDTVGRETMKAYVQETTAAASSTLGYLNDRAKSSSVMVRACQIPSASMCIILS